MKCLYCGCTDARACTGGCFWVDGGVCSSCALSPSDVGKFAKASLGDPDVKAIELIITDKKGGKTGYRVMGGLR